MRMNSKGTDSTLNASFVDEDFRYASDPSMMLQLHVPADNARQQIAQRIMITRNMQNTTGSVRS